MTRSREEVARELIQCHFEVEPGLSEIYWIGGATPDEKPVIMLLEVNANTLPTGSIEGFRFGATPEVPYATVIAEVTPEELAEMRAKGRLPAAWDLSTALLFTRESARHGQP